jgi:DNA-binding PadR family transcriptional regulator
MTTSDQHLGPRDRAATKPSTGGQLRTLDVILLGLLSTGERTGYDVRKWMDAHGAFVGHRAQTSQIYRQLARLVDLGWATTRTDPRDSGPDAKLYRLTDTGASVFTDWLNSPYVPARRPLDPDLQVRLRFAGRTGPSKALELVRTELAYRREQERARPLPLFDETAVEPGADAAEMEWQHEWYRLQSERGHYMTRTLMAWLEAVERRLEALAGEKR